MFYSNIDAAGAFSAARRTTSRNLLPDSLLRAEPPRWPVRLQTPDVARSHRQN
jgi:hypothetical protein